MNEIQTIQPSTRQMYPAQPVEHSLLGKTRQPGQTYMDLYNRLHNLEKFPDILPFVYESRVIVVK